MAAAVPIQIRDDTSREGIRPVDTTRDLPRIIDLIELGFRDELDPQGRMMLQQMRQMARQDSWLRFLTGRSLDLGGYVWIENGEVVGNISLRPALPYAGRGWLIGNVVVHPGYQGHGIGRALMESAVDSLEKREAHWVGLEVRADNQIARGLYERMGFQAIGRTLHMLRSPKLPQPQFPAPRSDWRPSDSEDYLKWLALAESIYQEKQRQVLEIRPEHYRFGGWERALTRWLQRQRERAWLRAGGEHDLGLYVRTNHKHRFHLWEMLIHPDEEGAGYQEVVAKALYTIRHRISWPVITIVTDQKPLVQLLHAVDFHLHRTLVQMMLPL